MLKLPSITETEGTEEAAKPYQKANTDSEIEANRATGKRMFQTLKLNIDYSNY